MRVRLAVIVIVSLSVVGACSSGASVASRPNSVGEPTVPVGTGQSTKMTVTCRDRTSDAGRLQQAIDSSLPGSVIDIGGAICLLTKGITFLADRTYTGYNTTGTILKQDGSMSYVSASDAYVHKSSTTGEPVTIPDLTVECDGSGLTDGIIILNWQADVEHVDVDGCGGSGIVDTNATADGQAITNTSVNSRFDDNFVSNSGQYGFEVYDSRNSVTDGFLDNNLIASPGLDGIHIDNAAGWNISSNHLYSDAHNGIYANRLYGTTISNNYIEDFGAKQESGTWYGIIATVQGGIGSTIFGNKIFNDTGEALGARYIYLGLVQANYGVGYLSVTGNVIVGDRSSDVGLLFDGGAHKLIVASIGNEVARVGTVISDVRGVTKTTGV